MTKEEVLKKFEKLGYECVCDSDRELVLEQNEEDDFYYKLYCKRIHIGKYFKSYVVVRITRDSINGYKQIPEFLFFEEHQLLTELFNALGWFDENN